MVSGQPLPLSLAPDNSPKTAAAQSHWRVLRQGHPGEAPVEGRSVDGETIPVPALSTISLASQPQLVEALAPL